MTEFVFYVPLNILKRLKPSLDLQARNQQLCEIRTAPPISGMIQLTGSKLIGSRAIPWKSPGDFLMMVCQEQLGARGQQNNAHHFPQLALQNC